MVRVRKVLCPIDFSEPSAEALHFAVALARRFDATLTLVNVYAVPGYALPEGAVLLGPKVMADVLAETERGLREWKARAERLGARRVDTLAAQGAADAEIVRVAREGAYDLIVMGTHGRTGLKHVLLGSVAEKVVRRAPCPVLTVRPADHRLELSSP